MATGTLLTIDDFERLPAEMAENHELVDGELVEVSGNTPRNNALRDYLIELLRPLVRKNASGKVFAEQEYDFLGNAHGPNVTFFGTAKLPLLDRNKRVQRFVPDLAIEIASDSEMHVSLFKKKERYLEGGTAEVWLIFPETREVLVYPANRILRGSDRLSTNLIPGFSITIDELLNED